MCFIDRAHQLLTHLINIINQPIIIKKHCFIVGKVYKSAYDFRVYWTFGTYELQMDPSHRTLADICSWAWAINESTMHWIWQSPKPCPWHRCMTSPPSPSHGFYKLCTTVSQHQARTESSWKRKQASCTISLACRDWHCMKTKSDI